MRRNWGISVSSGLLGGRSRREKGEFPSNHSNFLKGKKEPIPAEPHNERAAGPCAPLKLAQGSCKTPRQTAGPL
ncbi:hypothetical protein EPIB2_821 [Tritonibacter mobilis]|nr:hypothetical protein SCH4B_0417 [Ruegeria sp. TrichCH4B]VCU61744.1 hypothetical protein EPIB2_821 [Tritonibacter mobilis]